MTDAVANNNHFNVNLKIWRPIGPKFGW